MKTASSNQKQLREKLSRRRKGLAKKRKRERRARMEQLEQRRLLASDFTNTALPIDTNASGFVTPFDALNVINDLSANGIRDLEPAQGPVQNFVDVSGEGRVTPFDALLVLNALSADRDPPTVSVALSNDTGADGTDSLTFDPSLAGNADDQSQIAFVRVSVDGGDDLEVLADENGDFQFDPRASANVLDGPHSVSLVAVDIFTQKSEPITVTFTLDSVPPTIDVDLDPPSDSGVVGDQLTTQSVVDLTGQSEPATTIQIGGNDFLSDGSGAFSLTDIGLQDGINTLDFTVTDAAGNTADASKRFVKVDSDDAFGLVEGNRLAAQQMVSIDTGSDSDPRQAVVAYDISFDRSDASPFVQDVLNVFVVDSNDTSTQLIAGQATGEPVFAVNEQGPQLVAGVSSLRGNDLILDLSSIAGQDASLLFQFLTADGDAQGLTVIDSVVSLPLDSQSQRLSGLEDAPVSAAPIQSTDGLAESNQFSVTVDSTVFTETNSELKSVVTLTNEGSPTGRDIALVLSGLPIGSTVVGSETTFNGNPVVSVKDAIASGGLATGQSSQPVMLQIQNTNNEPFDLDIAVVVGAPNSAPQIDRIDAITTTPGDVVVQQIAATDSDGDALQFRLSSDGSLPTIQLTADGELTIRPEPDQVGTFNVSVEVSDGVATAQETFTLTVSDDQSGVTRLSGIVLDTDKNPIPGITTNIGSTAVLTDAEGRFLLTAPIGGFDADALEIHGNEFAGPEAFPFVAEKLPLLFEDGRDLFEGFENVIDRAIYLPALDVAGGSTVDPAIDVTVSQEISPGDIAAVFVAAGTLKDQQGQDFGGTLSITEVPRDLTPAALPRGVSPGTVVTIQPGEMSFDVPAPLTLPNRGGFPRGTEMDLFSINPVTGQFDNVGTGVVSNNGQSIETVSGGIRNSSWHFFTPSPDPERNFTVPIFGNPFNQDEVCNSCEAKATSGSGKNVGTSFVELHSGALRETHSLATYQSLGEERGVQLRYNSQRADLRPIVHFNVENAFGDFLLARASVNQGNAAVQVPGAVAGDFGLQGGENFWGVPGDGNDIEAAIQIDLQDQPTGIYNVTVDFGVHQFNGQNFIGTTTQSDLPVTIVNSTDSPFGAGWDWIGFQSIVESPDGRALVIDGAGNQLQFDPPTQPDGPFQSPVGDFTVLRKLGDGTFQRTSPNATVTQFNAANQVKSITDRNGNRTEFSFDADGRVTGFTDPVGLQTTFEYTGDRVSKIIDPQGRETLLGHDNRGNLIQITDADGSVRTFEYDAQHHMTAEINKRGFREEANYGFHGRVTGVQRRDGSGSQFNAAQVKGLFPANQTSSHLTAPFATVITTGAATEFADPNGNLNVVQLDQAGQTREQSDDEGSLGRTIRDEDNQRVAAIDGRGNGEFYEYDDRGNRTRIQHSIFDQSVDAVPNATVNLGGRSNSVRLADLDGDGDLDAVAANEKNGFELLSPFTESVTILENDGTGAFTNVSTLDVGDRPRQIEFADMDGDGTLDIVVSTQSGVSILRGQGGLAFEAFVATGIDGEIEGFELADIDQDNDIDVLVARDRETQLALLRNDGQGGLTVELLDFGTNHLDVAAADFNGDGADDIAVGTINSLQVMFADGAGGFAAPVSVSNLVANYFEIHVVDLNNDSRPDLIAASRGLVHRFLSQPDGSFLAQDLEAGTGNAEIVDIDAIDLNRDGFVELVALPANGQIVAFENVGRGSFDEDQRQVVAAGANAASFDLGDVDGDGDADMVAANSYGIAVIEGKLDGTFYGTQADENNVVALELFDFNGDGFHDIVSLSDNDVESIDIQLGRGDGTFGRADQHPIGIQNALDLAIGDFNLDGLNDVVVVAASNANISLFLQQADGSLVLDQEFAFDGSGQNIESADLNGDGIADIAATYQGDRRAIVLIGNGDGTFTSTEHEGDFANRGDDSLRIVDANEDGNLDLLGVTPNRFFAADNAVILFGDGNGGFGAPDENQSSIDARATNAADLNGDGVADFVVTGKGVSVAISEPDGTPGQPVVTDLLFDELSTGNELFDLDLDGDLDVATLLPQQGQLIILENDGTGQFIERSRHAVGDNPVGFDLADLDFDGDLDFVLATAFGIEVISNQTVHPCTSGLCDQVLVYEPDFNQPLSETDELGHVTLFDIDPNTGNILENRSVFGLPDTTSGENDDLVIQFTYKANGLIETETDPLGRVTRHDYDAFGQLERLTFAVGTADEASIQYEYDAAGNIAAVIDEAGFRTEHAYDPLNRLTETRFAHGGIFTNEYDAAGNLIRSVDALDRETEFRFDPMDRLVGKVDAVGNEATTIYDNFGNAIRKIDRLGRVTEIEYDSRDRPVATTDPEGHVIRLAYDANNNVVSTTDKNGNATKFAFDQADRGTVTVDALAQSSVRGFTPNGLVAHTSDALGRTTRSFYDEADRVVRMLAPDPDREGPAESPVWIFEYDAVGNQIREIDPAGSETVLEYDNRDRVIRKIATDPDGAGPLESPITTYRYDARSLEVEIVDPIGRSIEYEYDELGRQTLTRRPDPDGDGPDGRPEFATEYDLVNNVVSTTDALGNQSVSEYDALNRLVRNVASDPDGAGPLESPVTQFVYDAEGQLVESIDPLGRTSRFEYDGLGRPLRRVAPDPDGDGPTPTSVTQYTYDAVGNQTSMVDPNGNRTDFFYDPLNRRVRTELADPDGEGPKQRPVVQQVYDAASQVVAMIDPLSRRTDNVYDDLGRLVEMIKPDPDGDGPDTRPTTRYEIDVVGNVTAMIDPLGNRTEYDFDALHRPIRFRLEDPDGDGPLNHPENQQVYDAAGQLISVIDALGRETRYDHDGLGKIFRVTKPDPDGAGPLTSPVSTLKYDLVGNVLETTDSLGNTTQNVYDNLYRHLSITLPDPDGAGPETNPTYTFEYDVASQLISETDALGRTITYDFDDMGRITRTTSPDPDGDGPRQASVATVEFDLNSNQVATTDALGNVTRFEFDGLNRSIRTILPDPDGDGPDISPTILSDFDAANQLLSTTDPLGRVSSSQYDQLGRITRQTQPDPDGDGPLQSSFVDLSYDLANNLIASTDALQNTTQFEYDNLYRTIRETDPTGGVVQQEYDELGRRTALVDQVLNRTEWQYDELDRVVAMIDPLGNQSTMEYDAEGNLLSKTDRLGRVIEYDYDNLYRQIAETWFTNGVQDHEITYQYDLEDQLVAAGDTFADYIYQYDNKGLRSQQTIQFASLPDQVAFDYEYDIDNRITLKSAAIGGVADFANQYTYDALDRPVSIQQQPNGGHAVAPKRFDVEFDAASQPTLVSRFAALDGTQQVVATTYEFDVASRIIALNHATADGLLSDLAWAYDIGNRVTTFTNSQDGTATYTHDDRNQLTDADYDFQDDIALEFDASGNRVGGENVVGANNRTQSDAVFDYEYDAEGNRTRQTNRVTGQVTEYEWDHRNRLVQVTDFDSLGGNVTQQVVHTYDIFNRWIETSADFDGQGPQASVDRAFIYENNNIVLGFSDDDLTNRYLWGIGSDQLISDEVVTSTNQVGEVRWTLGDQVNTIRDIVGFDAGTGEVTVLNHIQYDAHGNVTNESDATIDVLFGYTGRPFDDATGLQNNLNRWYDARLGKWISEDPIGFDAGDANLSRYVANSPLRLVDPNGLDFDIGFLFKPITDDNVILFNKAQSEAVRDAVGLSGKGASTASSIADASGDALKVVDNVVDASSSLNFVDNAAGFFDDVFDFLDGKDLDRAFDLLQEATKRGVSNALKTGDFLHAARTGLSLDDIVAQAAKNSDDVARNAQALKQVADSVQQEVADQTRKKTLENVSKNSTRVTQALNKSKKASQGLLSKTVNFFSKAFNSRVGQAFVAFANSPAGKTITKGSGVGEVTTLGLLAGIDVLGWHWRGQVYAERMQNERIQQQHLDKIRKRNNEQLKIQNQLTRAKNENTRLEQNAQFRERQKREAASHDQLVRAQKAKAERERKFIEEQREKIRGRRIAARSIAGNVAALLQQPEPAEIASFDRIKHNQGLDIRTEDTFSLRDAFENSFNVIPSEFGFFTEVNGRQRFSSQEEIDFFLLRQTVDDIFGPLTTQLLLNFFDSLLDELDSLEDC